MLEAQKVEYQSVYILRNLACPPNRKVGKGSRLYYVGISNNVEKRVKEHNDGKSPATRGGVWELVTVLNFRQKHEAAIVEQWLKNGDTRKKREEIIERMAQHGNSERECFAIYRFASKWWDKKIGRDEQEGLDV